MDDFTLMELKLPYGEWAKLSEQRRTSLNKKTLKWLAEWNHWDFACSPMDDDKRQMLRCGHYLGWFAHDRCKAK